jgi:excisionase family DNA binding protein
MKRYCTVKEAARLLGVSTNTIYTYQKEGKIDARRIGRGRMKIPYQQLAPFIGGDQIQTPSVSEQNLSQKTIPSDFTTSQLVTKVGDYEMAAGKNDIFFYRIFKGVTFLGLGLIYFLTAKDIFVFSGTFLDELGQVLTSLLPLSLIFAGILNILDVVYGVRIAKYHLLIDLFTCVVLSYFSFISLTGGAYGRFVFAAAFAGVALGHLLVGSHDEEKHTFFESFSRLCLYLAIIGAIVLVLYPPLFPFPLLNPSIEAHLGVFAFVWLLVLVVPIVFIISPYSTNSRNSSVYFTLSSLFALLIGTQLLLVGKWDMSYLSFITAVFGLFLAWWNLTDLKLHLKKISFLIMVFSWISGSLIFGILVLRASQDELIKNEEIQLGTQLDQVVVRLSTAIETQAALLTSFAGEPEMKQILAEENYESAILTSKEIYEKSEGISRVVIFNKAGVAIGVYPRNSMVQGTDYSSQEYFQTTKENSKGYISGVSRDTTGVPSVIQTEPVFNENNFIGMVGVSLDSEKYSLFYRGLVGAGSEIYAADESGTVIFSSQDGDLGRKISDVMISRNVADEMIINSQGIGGANWKVYMETSTSSLLNRLSKANIYLALLLLFNSLISMGVGIAVVSEKSLFEGRGLLTGKGLTKSQLT